MLVALRATHEHLDLDVLDALTRGADTLPAVIGQVQDELLAERNRRAVVEPDRAGAERILTGWAVIDTCNRLEIYLDTTRFHDGIDLVIEAITRTSGLSRDVVAMCFEAARDSHVAQHLNEVTSGLRSLVLGEAEIAGQVRAAYERAQRDGLATSLLHDLFQHAFRCQKQVATQAPVGAAGRSGAAVALDRAAAELGGWEGRRVLIVGTGAYARLGVAELVRRGVTELSVFSGSGRAAGFAERHGIAMVEREELDQAIIDADLVLACSGRGTTLFPEQFLHAGCTIVLDLALHSDLHPLVRHLKGVTVIGLADLKVGDPAGADTARATAERIVAEHVEAFRVQQEVRRVDPAMAALRREVADTADAEIDRLRQEVAGETADQLERSIRRILAKVMHNPAARARHLAETGHADAYVEAFHTIFGIDISTTPEDAQSDSARGDLEPVGWMRVDRTVLPRLDETESPATVIPAQTVARLATREASAAPPAAAQQPPA